MKVLLSIAGSDSSGGAGIQADLKTFEAFGLFGSSAITALTAQNSLGVQMLHPLPAEFVKKQIESVLEDFDVAAIKIGMLYSKEIIKSVAEVIKNLDIPIILDPVFISKSGAQLLQKEAIEAMRELFAYATLITPNIYEAQRLFGYKYGDTPSLSAMIDSPTPILLKNEILEFEDGPKSIDQLFFKHQKRLFESPALKSHNTHGTGCSYSSAIAANMALGKSLEEAIAVAKDFIYRAILNAPNIGHGVGPINHKRGVEC